MIIFSQQSYTTEIQLLRIIYLSLKKSNVFSHLSFTLKRQIKTFSIRPVKMFLVVLIIVLLFNTCVKFTCNNNKEAVFHSYML
jgi:hypothetical protein